MKRELGLENVQRNSASVVTVGTFDGVHVGHQALVRYLVRRAEEQGGCSVVVTFNPHPREVVRSEAVPLLTTVEERAAVLERLGVDRFILIEFTKVFSLLSPEAFVEDVLVAQVGLKEIVIGYDHGFGRGRQGDAELLERLGAQHNFTVDVIPAQEVAAHVVSSSEIRQLLESGDVKRATEMLGRYYELTGTVIHGDQRGRTIGYPTANIIVSNPRKVVPMQGVYAVQVTILGETTAHGGMMNIGQRPTFDGDGIHLEVHLFDYDGDLYERELRVEFVERIRDESKFSGVEALVEQLSRDATRSKAALAETVSAAGIPVPPVRS